MECPSCGAAVRDPEAVFCARCGNSLRVDPASTSEAPTVGGATSPQQSVDPGSAPQPSYDPGPAPLPGEPSAEGAVTSQQRPGPPDRPSIESPIGGYTGGPVPPPDTAEETPAESKAASVPVREFAIALRRSFASGGWGRFAGAAAVGWLTLVGLGALIVAAAAVGSGGFGSGIDVLDTLSLVVLFGLSVMGVSLELSNLGPVGQSFAMIWIGALAMFGYALSWATARVVAHRSPVSTRALMIEGAKVGVPFALYCLLAALLFRITDVGTLGASAPQAFFLGLIWGVAFGALGGLRSKEPVSAIWGRLLEWVKSYRRAAYEGLASAGVMLGTTALASAAAFLLMIIIALARGDSLDGLTLGSVVAALIVLTLTLPNVLSLIASVSLGAPLSGVTGALGVESISIIGFGGRTSGTLILLLLLIPLVSCTLGGFSAYRQSVDRSKVTDILVTAACVYAGSLAVLALLNGFSFGSGVEGVNISVASTNFLLVALLGLIWAGIFGFAGWKLGEMQDPDAPRGSTPREETQPPTQGYAPPGYGQGPARPPADPDRPAPPTTEHRPPSDG